MVDDNYLLIATVWSFHVWYHLISSDVFRRPGNLQPNGFRSKTNNMLVLLWFHFLSTIVFHKFLI